MLVDYVKFPQISFAQISNLVSPHIIKIVGDFVDFLKIGKIVTIFTKWDSIEKFQL